MISVEIWHVKTELFAKAQLIGITGDGDLPFPESYDQVAVWAVADQSPTRDAYEMAYELSQNRDEPWHDSALRSTSMGDVVIIDGVAKRVAMLGWESLSNLPS